MLSGVFFAGEADGGGLSFDSFEGIGGGEKGDVLVNHGDCLVPDGEMSRI